MKYHEISSLDMFHVEHSLNSVGIMEYATLLVAIHDLFDTYLEVTFLIKMFHVEHCDMTVDFSFGNVPRGTNTTDYSRIRSLNCRIECSTWNICTRCVSVPRGTMGVFYDIGT
jgi:hypothetical protein